MPIFSESEFIAKVKTGESEDVQNALRENPSLADSKDSNGISAVMLAVYHGHRALADWLAAHGANLNFFEACALGRSATVTQLLREDPALASAYSPDGFQGLGLASFFGNADVVRALLDAGADPNSRSRNSMRVSPIHSAAANRNPGAALEIIRLLVTQGADVNVVQHGGWTPLQEGAAHGNTELVEFLLANGADQGAQAENGKTALDLATEGNHADTIAILKTSITAGRH